MYYINLRWMMSTMLQSIGMRGSIYEVIHKDLLSKFSSGLYRYINV